MDLWQPDVYERFKAERDKPFLDLLGMLALAPGGRMVDLGCGTGELTARAHRTLGVSETVGLDRSEAMLERARAQVASGLRFASADVATVEPDGDYDVVLSNAVLHWIPDHEHVIARWAGALRPKGQIAVQVPANFDSPSHTVGFEVAAEPDFEPYLREVIDAPRQRVLAPEQYSDLLFDLGFAEQHVRLQVYLHVLPSTADVVEWTRATFLLQFEERLEPAVYERFIDRYRARLIEVCGDRSPYPFTFKRILLHARMA